MALQRLAPIGRRRFKRSDFVASARMAPLTLNGTLEPLFGGVLWCSVLTLNGGWVSLLFMSSDELRNHPSVQRARRTAMSRANNQRLPYSQVSAAMKSAEQSAIARLLAV